MKKRHGPDFYAQMIVLDNCRACRGRAVVKPLFYEVACPDCNGSGWVNGDTGEAIPLEVLATQLGLRYRESVRECRLLAHELSALKKQSAAPCAESAYYDQNNRRGAGGTNYTGD